MIGGLADRQHGVVGRGQLLAMGITEDAIEHRLRCGRLRRVHRGVYAVGHRQLTREGVWLAAVLAGGEGAALSHWSAATHVALRRGGGPLAHVTLPTQRRSRDGIRFHTATLQPDEVIEKEGIPTTSPGRTLIDLAPLLSDAALSRVIEAADQIAWTGPSLPDLCERYARRAGVTRLKARWQGPIARTRSDFEAEVLEAIRTAGLPLPELNQQIEGFEVDMVWGAQRLIAEIDTYTTHGSRFAFERDRERDRILQLAGWRVVRITPVNLANVVEDLQKRASRSGALN